MLPLSDHFTLQYLACSSMPDLVVHTVRGLLS
jgi:hypothetical protein